MDERSRGVIAEHERVKAMQIQIRRDRQNLRRRIRYQTRRQEQAIDNDSYYEPVPMTKIHR